MQHFALLVCFNYKNCIFVLITKLERHHMKNTLLSIWNFYLEGFRSMTLGRTLWIIILLKLFVMFFILKLFFFPDFLGDHPTDADKGTYVGNELIQRAIPEKSTDF